MTPAGVVLSVSPHPDDELVGAGGTLMALRDGGWRIVNLACSLGRPEDRARRRAELAEACRLAGFELVVPEGLPPIGRDDDLARAERELSSLISSTVEQAGAELIVGPSPHDGHHGHEAVGRAIRDAVEAARRPARVMFWGLWGDLPAPNVLVAFGPDRLAEIQRALAAHAGELARNRLDRLVEGRAATNAVLGPERVFGFGASGIEQPYAELLTDVAWSPGRGWRLMAPHELDPGLVLGVSGIDGPGIGWWLHAPSVRDGLRHRRN